jgi:hypothetical protein
MLVLIKLGIITYLLLLEALNFYFFSLNLLFFFLPYKIFFGPYKMFFWGLIIWGP